MPTLETGLVVSGHKFYHTEARGQSVCGLLELCAFSSCSVTKEKAPDYLKVLSKAYTYSNNGNFLFSISSEQLKTTTGLLGYLLKHPNTKIIHAYKNNAHGPSCVFICIHHRDPEDVEFIPDNNVAKWKAIQTYDMWTDGYHIMEKVKEEENA